MNIKVVCLNIWQGNLLSESIDFIKSQSADIVLLQEVYNGSQTDLQDKYRSFSILKTELNYATNVFAMAYLEHLPYGPVHHGNAILSHFPSTASSVYFMVDPVDPDFEYQDISEHWPLLPPPLQQVELDTPAGLVNVFNMHGPWDLDGDNFSPKRQRMSQVILRETKEVANVILAGDSNAKASNQAMISLEPQLKSVFGQEVKSTFNMRRKDNPGYATAAVDHMFTSSNIKVISKTVLDVDVSDHLPLVVELQIV